MVELLAAALTGGNFSFEFDWSQHPGAQTPWTGQLVIVIDPAQIRGKYQLRSSAAPNWSGRCTPWAWNACRATAATAPGPRRLAAGIPSTAELAKLRELAT